MEYGDGVDDTLNNGRSQSIHPFLELRVWDVQIQIFNYFQSDIARSDKIGRKGSRDANVLKLECISVTTIPISVQNLEQITHILYAHIVGEYVKVKPRVNISE